MHMSAVSQVTQCSQVLKEQTTYTFNRLPSGDTQCIVRLGPKYKGISHHLDKKVAKMQACENMLKIIEIDHPDWKDDQAKNKRMRKKTYKYGYRIRKEEETLKKEIEEVEARRQRGERTFDRSSFGKRTPPRRRSRSRSRSRDRYRRRSRSRSSDRRRSSGGSRYVNFLKELGKKFKKLKKEKNVVQSSRDDGYSSSRRWTKNLNLPFSL